MSQWKEQARICWAVACLLSICWAMHERSRYALIVEQNQLLRRLDHVQGQWLTGLARVNYLCGETVEAMLNRLGLDPRTEAVLTTALVERYELGGEYADEDQKERASRRSISGRDHHSSSEQSGYGSRGGIGGSGLE